MFLEGGKRIDKNTIVDNLSDKKLKKFIQYFHTDENFFFTFNGKIIIYDFLGVKLMINELYVKTLKLNKSKVS